METFPDLRELEIWKPGNSEISCLSELRLKVLVVSAGDYVDGACDLFSNHSPLSRSIERLSLNRVGFNDRGQLFLDRMAESCSDLVELSLSCCRTLSINFSTYFTSAHFPNLRHLDLFWTNVNGFSDCHLPTLELLTIGTFGRPTTDDNVRSILLGCPSLVWLRAHNFIPSLDFLKRWATIGRNCLRAWEAPLIISSFRRWPTEVHEYAKNLGLAWEEEFWA